MVRLSWTYQCHVKNVPKQICQACPNPYTSLGGDSELAAGPFEQNVYRQWSCVLVGELLAGVGEDFERKTPSGDCGKECLDRGVARRSLHDRGDDDEPGVVIDPGGNLAFSSIDKEQSADQIQLPQMHLGLPISTVFRSVYVVALAD